MIKDIIFFNNFGLYSQCQLEATKRGQKVSQFMADCVAKQTGANTFKKDKELFIACQQGAEKEGISIADYIEKCCAEVVGMTYKSYTRQKKGGFLDLNRDA